MPPLSKLTNFSPKILSQGTFSLETFSFGTSALKPSILAILAAIFLIISETTYAESDEPFLPTWKLLKSAERSQFIAGYLYGWRDAAKVTGIAIEFVKENPKDAVEGLTKLQSLYTMEGLKADVVSKELDTFFSKSENKDATLSQAVTAVRAQLQ